MPSNQSITIPLFVVFYLACHLFCFCLWCVENHGKSLKSVKFTVFFRSSLHQFLSISLIPTKFDRLFQRKIKLISALGPWSLVYFRFFICFRFLSKHGYSAFDSSIPRRDLRESPNGKKVGQTGLTGDFAVHVWNGQRTYCTNATVYFIIALQWWKKTRKYYEAWKKHESMINNPSNHTAP